MVEDSVADALLIEYSLRRAGISFDARRVETREDYIREIRQSQPDLILSDHGLPTFDGYSALEIAQEICPRTPFIFVTGSGDQAMMNEMLDSGATDFVFKNRLGDLVSALRRALDQPAEIPQEEVKPMVAEPAKPPVPNLDAFRRRSELQLCCICKKVVNSGGEKIDLDVFLQSFPETTFRTFVCPACGARLN